MKAIFINNATKFLTTSRSIPTHRYNLLFFKQLIIRYLILQKPLEQLKNKEIHN